MKKTIKFALKKSIPVLFGYLFLGIAFGLLLQQAGYNFLWAFAISLLVYAGSMQFVLVSLLSAGASLPTVAVMTLLINSRHIFYGISFVEKFKKMKKSYPYMVFSLTDETYSLLCSCTYPEDVDEHKATFFISLFNQTYWVFGSVLGGLIGQAITFDFKGIEFSMTALFVVIFIEKWFEFKNHLPAIIGLVCSAFFLFLFGADNFILPSLIVTVTALMLCKNYINKEAGGINDAD